MRASKWIFVLACFAALAVFGQVGSRFGVDLATKIMVLAVFALSLELLVGMTGLVCFGQAAFFGIGAYATVLLSPSDGPASILVLLPLCMLLAGAYALVVGALSLRTQGVYFIMVTLAFAQMAYYVVLTRPWAVAPMVFTSWSSPVWAAGWTWTTRRRSTALRWPA